MDRICSFSCLQAAGISEKLGNWVVKYLKEQTQNGLFITIKRYIEPKSKVEISSPESHQIMEGEVLIEIGIRKK